MSEPKKLYKTVITYVVLSESPVTGEDLSSLLLECDAGSDVGYEQSRECKEISTESMIEELKRAGSEPSFFQLEVEDDDPDLLSNLGIGDEVQWNDPDNGTCSGLGTVIEIRTESGVVEGPETILWLKMNGGSEVEAFVRECS